MKVEKLFTHSFNRNAGGSDSYTMGRGKVQGILITSSSGASLDKLSLKLRSNKSTIPLAINLTHGAIGTISDQNYGVRSSLGLSYVFSSLITQVETLITETSGAGSVGQLVKDVAGIGYYAIYLPLGHITLGESELELVTQAYNSGSDLDVTNDYYAVHLNDEPDKFFVYDETKDFDTTQDKVREIYFASTSSLLSDGAYDEIEIQIDEDEGQTFLSDVKGLLCASNIFGQIDGVPELRNVRIYSESSPIPSRVRVKVSGTDLSTADNSLIFVKELIDSSVSRSTVQNLSELTAKVEKLEKKDPETAEAYRHAGSIVKSEELREVKTSVS